MKDRAASGSSVSDDRAPGPSSAPRLAQLLAYSRIQDLATIQDKLVEMEEYTRKLAAVQELKDLLEQENESASELSTILFNGMRKCNKYVPTLSVLLAECCKMLQEK
ncbi:hypothetical protein PC129_g578 [Phytophthora cactorum]|uniref:Uncharacterized protein n=1 Tax=Phytophthora cactorum TaxID=29920 RepID=A0A329SZL6_9STRA|nr:hypothetical protein Pcac1_g6295 [Phytophthora cactorum]KAG2845409.1 hypothetical protein PC112_g1850 [Phytophthora cactorum]KAG2846500.1 hypothetical protein PC111_g1190 [Phytophthora cactorum]KAG2867566.1 hypothetical protein PC113_g1862 [Phytophthora cactorum]KAG2931378.1 hypothetical protein PC114_g2176 [Phytophthora cactorum]